VEKEACTEKKSRESQSKLGKLYREIAAGIIPLLGNNCNNQPNMLILIISEASQGVKQ
jgi:hypothetical protein